MTAQQKHSISNDNIANELKITPAIIEQALQFDLGPEAKKLVIQCIQQKYGMDFELVGQYKTEFENYLRELLHESAEVIIARIESAIEDSKRRALTMSTTTPPSSKRLSDTVHFLFCDQCYWSASLLTTTFELKCMSCNSELKCALPISSNEAFRYEINSKRGLALFFS
ncbi:hypothetical protein Ngar_c33130 [Candidatus Nitrososphaera gargensis Ga9.2]|uniref:Uncharacterized protein n=1 Tax=Nitrososphaera gargensis (strain Ga9.2) TaxID=1237085 RepID=K0IL85_NITGG|nr:hypothetical protein [Candidatus Nitrososphaera gargensis]AFU60228.1 hypothetical protein Ngar_c33130 [Candidatus Nitrososphaera gargensis Ga9.2]